MTGDLRRQLILSAAKRCFARHGFAGTTTKSVAAAASISEGLLFKHFPTKSALYAEILAEECEADPALHRLLDMLLTYPSAESIAQAGKILAGYPWLRAEWEPRLIEACELLHSEAQARLRELQTRR